jgi:hypothetical protein
MKTSMSNQVNKIFEDLEKYRDFCVDYGYKFDERTLYDMRSFAFQQYMKFAAGKNAKNMWVEDAKRYEMALNNF